MKRPAFGTLLIACIPFVATCFSVPLWDRIYPMILGMPFNLFWLASWTILTPACMWVAYCVETSHASSHLHPQDPPQ